MPKTKRSRRIGLTAAEDSPVGVRGARHALVEHRASPRADIRRPEGRPPRRGCVVVESPRAGGRRRGASRPWPSKLRNRRTSCIQSTTDAAPHAGVEGVRGPESPPGSLMRHSRDRARPPAKDRVANASSPYWCAFKRPKASSTDRSRCVPVSVGWRWSPARTWRRCRRSRGRARCASTGSRARR